MNDTVQPWLILLDEVRCTYLVLRPLCATALWLTAWSCPYEADSGVEGKQIPRLHWNITICARLSHGTGRI